MTILFWNIENLTLKSSKNDPYFDDFLSINYSFNKIQKRNGIAQKKWTKINVQF